MTDQTESRLTRLEALADECLEVYDATAAAALDGEIPCPRYALLTSEGSPESSYRDNPNLTVHDSVARLARVASGELADGWCPLTMVDLDTGEELGWEIAVRVDASTPTEVAR